MSRELLAHALKSARAKGDSAQWSKAIVVCRVCEITRHTHTHVSRVRVCVCVVVVVVVVVVVDATLSLSLSVSV